MNPNTIKTKTDAFKVRNAYLANLEAEQRNLDKTARAVAVFNQTGQTPIPPQDTRSVTQKLGDIQKLKTDFRKQLLSITDGAETEKIMFQINDDEVAQASMLLSDIISQLKPKYPLGVPAPVFVEFLRRYLRDFNKNLGLASGTQEEIANELKLTNRQITDAVLPNQQTMIDLLRIISDLSGGDSSLRNRAMSAVSDLSSALPDSGVWGSVDSLLDETERRQANDLINDVISEAPNSEQVRNLSRDLIDAQRSGSRREVNNVLNNIIETIQIDADNLNRLRKANEIISNVSSREEVVDFPMEAPREKSNRVQNVAEKMAERGIGVSGRQLKPTPIKKKALKEAQEIIDIEDATADELEDVVLRGLNPKKRMINWFDFIQRQSAGVPLSAEKRAEYEVMRAEELFDLIKEIKGETESMFGKPVYTEKTYGGEKTLMELKGEALEEASADYGSARIMPSYGKGIKPLVKGRGLSKGLTKKTFPDRVDYEKGIKADKTYIPFGKYALNSQKLAGGTLMIKTMKGGAVHKLPTIGISPALGGIIKKMIGGGLPTYNEMSSLSDDEKNTLYKVFKLSQIDKADLLPSPDKTKEEQEMNRFQILKGQIQAGNDSKELIKEFKVMLLKFISMGKIPKAQGMDIITELMAMGY